MKTDPRIDHYIEKAQEFAKPILIHFRNLVHAVCPNVEETIKWQFPHFDYKGEMMCHMAAFKQHCAIGFWKAALMADPKLMELAASEVSMGHLGRITSLSDLPSDKVLKGYLREAMRLNDQGVRLPGRKKTTTEEIPVPETIQIMLQKNPEVWRQWEAFSPSCRNEYTTWITEAKTETTRQRRLEQALNWISAGKKRNWKYES